MTEVSAQTQQEIFFFKNTLLKFMDTQKIPLGITLPATVMACADLCSLLDLPEDEIIENFKIALTNAKERNKAIIKSNNDNNPETIN